MKRYLDTLPLHWLALAVWGFFVVLLTTLPGRSPLVRELALFIGGTETAAAGGHFALFAMLTLLMWRALCGWFRPRHALLMAMAAALLIGTTTELFQWFVSDRNSTLHDLLANWLGVFVAGFIVSFWGQR